jgi:hypothetical protein
MTASERSASKNHDGGGMSARNQPNVVVGVLYDPEPLMWIGVGLVVLAVALPIALMMALGAFVFRFPIVTAGLVGAACITHSWLLERRLSRDQQARAEHRHRTRTAIKRECWRAALRLPSRLQHDELEPISPERRIQNASARAALYALRWEDEVLYLRRAVFADGSPAPPRPFSDAQEARSVANSLIEETGSPYVVVGWPSEQGDEFGVMSVPLNPHAARLSRAGPPPRITRIVQQR